MGRSRALFVRLLLRSRAARLLLRSRAARLGALLVGVGAVALAGCTNVKFSSQNPQTGEVWTVTEHTFGSDTVSYCPPPGMGAPCRTARMLDAPPPVSPANWANQQQPQPQPTTGPFGLPLPPGFPTLPIPQWPFPPLFPGQQPQQQQPYPQQPYPRY